MAIDLNDSELRQFLREVMTRKGLNVNSWSKLAGKAEGTLRQFFDDPSRSLKVTTLKNYLDVVGMSLSDLRKHGGLREDSRKFTSHSSKGKVQGADQLIPVIGYIGANGRFYPYESKSGKYKPEEVDISVTAHIKIPASEILALKIKGDDMLPVMREGWIVFCHSENNIRACLRQLSFVKVKNGASYIRELREGRKAGYHMLISHTGALMEDVKIEWAYPIISIEPR